MTNEEFFSALEALDDGLLEGAEADMMREKRSHVWVRWAAAAACLCLIVGAGAGVLRHKAPNGGAGFGGDAGGDGSWPEGVDPAVASIAVYPAGTDLRDVAGAELVDLDTGDTGELGGYLPDTPEGMELVRATLYRTVMKDGTEYNMLRASYAVPEEGGPAPGEDLCVMVYDHVPEISGREIYDSDTVRDYLASQTQSGLKVAFTVDSVCVNIVNHGLTPGELLELVDTIIG